MPPSSLILASASPRRRELLTWAGLEFDTALVQVSEEALAGESPVELVRRLALAKAEAAARPRPGAWILGADTVVVLDGLIMGKPVDRTEAALMLGRLSGRTHQVLTGICLLHRDANRLFLDHVATAVEFRTLSELDIRLYLDSGEAWDKAGAYAIQGRGAALIKTIQGSYTNVIGLPLAEVLGWIKSLA
ncbi:MAG: Maf family protein [Thermodesulfobacteriota bacterium]